MEKVNEPRSVVLKQTIWVAGLIVLVLTPWVNIDSLIIPKIVLLFSLAMYLLPSLMINVNSVIPAKTFKLLITLSTLFLIQMIFSISTSSAPLEQQFFGRGGRGLGLLTYLSVLIIMLIVAIYAKTSETRLIQQGSFYSGGITSVYSIMQNHNLDIFEWNTKTNGIIGTLGNPNFQSSYAAAVLLPAVTYLWTKRFRNYTVFLSTSLFLYTVYIANSTQGYVVLLSSTFISALIWTWYSKRKVFYLITIVFTFTLFAAVLGVLNKGPLSYYLFKVSVTSRGEFWRTAIAMIKSNPINGVGIDSFGDFSQMYKDQKTVNGINEFTDNSHNYFLEFASTGGILLAIIYGLLIVLALFCFYKVQKRKAKFDSGLISIFTFWVGLQLQSLISPGSIALIMWNFILIGFIVGIYFKETKDFESTIVLKKLTQNSFYVKPFAYFLLFISLIITYPLFNADKTTLQAFRNTDGLLAVKAAKMYPESTVRYSNIGQELVQSQLWPQALEVGRAASMFNKNSVSAWLVILSNPTAPLQERIQARENILRLDPLNESIRKLSVK